MEQNAPGGQHPHRDLRRWTPSPVSDNEPFEQYAFQPIPNPYNPGAEYFLQAGLPQGRDQVPLDDFPKTASSTLQPVQDPRKQPETKKRVQWSFWTWEIANCLLLLISLFAILATLYPHDGQPLPQWPFSITINALLSIYTVIMKTSMLLILTSGVGQLQWSWFLHPRSLKDVVRYHEAAEGPLGSLSWLCRYHIRQPLTALAAVIIIAAVAVDPFVQQLVKPVDCKQLEDGGPPASMPRTNYLSYDRDAFPSDVLATIASGYYTPQNLSDFTCGTGNCTFGTEYRSLAYCSICEDVSDSVRIEENCMIYHNKKLEPGSCHKSDIPREAAISEWNLTTTLAAAPSPLSLNFHRKIDTNNFTVVTPKQNIFGIGRISRRLDTSGLENTVSYIGLGNDLGVIFAKSDVSLTPYDPNNQGDRAGCDNAATNNTWWCRQYGAAKCSLQPCVRSYTANVDGGRLTETLIGQSDTNMTWGYGESAATEGLVRLQNFLGVVDTQCINDAERQGLVAAGYKIDDKVRWLPYNLTFNPRIDTPVDAAFPQSLLAHECLFTIDAEFNNDIWTFVLNQFIVGIVQRQYPDNEIRPSYSGPTQLLSLFDSSHVNEATIRDAMNRLADAITLWIRTHGYASHSQRAVGEEYHYAICVKVNWNWVALPAVLTGLTMTFFLLMVISTYRQRLPIWKKSPLTLLFHGPGGTSWIDPNLVAPASKPATEIDLATDRGTQDFADRITVQVSRDEYESPGLRQVEPRSVRMRKPRGVWPSKSSTRHEDNNGVYSGI
ncbi:hypothetical protein NUW58_g6695 [Xylaria curta]|uniref:Uncharacterized protein n=1 Tax=Xylaria curta TaxID=42375 RepID=A0ACC1NQQ6_9PEZI|nr:hypothetical protein NUW58_g6695 [Xylaria curta]